MSPPRTTGSSALRRLQFTFPTSKVSLVATNKKEQKNPTPDTVKRHRQSLKHRARNRHNKSTMRSAIKKIRELIAAGKTEAAQAELSTTVSTIQTVAQKGVIHRRQAARRVSRLAHAVNALKASKA